jgi:small subunit ribosomal protein S1
VHLSDLDWNRSGEEAVKDHAKGDMLKVKILGVDVAHRVDATTWPGTT